MATGTRTRESEKTTKRRRRIALFSFAFLVAVALALVAVQAFVPAGSDGGGQAETAVQTDTATQVSSRSSNETSDDADDTETDGTDTEPADGQISLVAEDKEGESYAAGEVLVRFDEGITVAQARQALSAVGLSADRQDVRACLEDGSFCTAQVEGADSVRDALEAIADNAIDGIASAQANYFYVIADSDTEEGASQAGAADTESASDESTDSSDSYANIASSINDTYASKQWHLEAINAYEAWDIGTTDGKVSIAIIDTGVDADHADLSDQLLAEYGYNSVNGRNDFDDTYGHGTHVAGIAAATSNNGTGVSGTSYNANIIPIKAGYTDRRHEYFTTEWLVDAYDYLLADKDGNGTSDLVEDANLHVVNMSLGSLDSVSSDDALCQAIDEAYEQGILTVCAAGNESTENVGDAHTNWPSDYETCVSVIALDEGLKRISSSNYGDAKDIAAPGSSIYSTACDGGYEYKTGTSMASPVVAGVAALIFAQNDGYTPADVRTILETTAQDLGDEGYDTETGCCCVDAAAALESAMSRTLTEDMFSVDTDDEEYTGSKIVKTIDSDLVEGSDYTVSYADNMAVGTATITIKGTGDYIGTLTYRFTIVEQTIAVGGKTVNLSATATAAETGAVIVASKTEGDMSGSTYGALKAKCKKVAKKKQTVAWRKVSAADGYIVYGAKCGTGNSYKKLKTTSGTKYTRKGLKTGAYYKYIVVAYKNVAGTRRTIAVSKTVHTATADGNYTNPKKVAVAAKSVTLSAGETFKLEGMAVKRAKGLTLKKHCSIRYESADTSVAKVGAKGRITAKGTGTCSVYAYAQNGVCAKVEVTVK